MTSCLKHKPDEARPSIGSANETLIFSDEFDQGELDRDKWNVEGPDFWVNNEEQSYIDSPETIRILPSGSVEGAEGGVLELRAVHRPAFQAPNGRISDFVSGRIDTREKFGFTHGRAAARVRLPKVAGVWPAFWMLGHGKWPDTGEIDILEYAGEKDWTGVAVHGPGYSGATPLVNKYFFPSGTDAADWHVYGVKWDNEKILFSIDDRLVYCVTRPMVTLYGEWRFDTPKFLILNLALGGEYPFKTNGVKSPYYGLPASSVDQIRQDGVAIQVDWVRVTQRCGVA